MASRTKCFACFENICDVGGALGKFMKIKLRFDAKESRHCLTFFSTWFANYETILTALVRKCCAWYDQFKAMQLSASKFTPMDAWGRKTSSFSSLQWATLPDRDRWLPIGLRDHFEGSFKCCVEICVNSASQPQSILQLLVFPKVFKTWIMWATEVKSSIWRRF